MSRKIDLMGQKFGLLTIIGEAESRNGRAFWLAKCECGTVKEVPTDALRKGRSKSCGCNSYHYFNDLTGKKISKLKILRRADDGPGKRAMWMCQCECGNEKVISGKDILSGHTKSCGCFRKEVSGKKNKLHGKSKTPLYAVWRTMKDRCLNVKTKSYKNYGGRGIKVCDDWQFSFSRFNEWANNNGYKPGLTIERIDVNGNYEPENCCWIPSSEQAKNRRNVVFIEYKGIKKNVSEWANFFGVTRATIQHHYKRGTIDEAFDKYADRLAKELEGKGYKTYIVQE